MGTLVSEKQRALAQIKADAASSVSVPELRLQVELLTDEIQKIKDVLLGKEEVMDD